MAQQLNSPLITNEEFLRVVKAAAKRWLYLAALPLAMSCGDDSTSPAPIDVAMIFGIWHLVVEPSQNTGTCQSAENGGPLDYYLYIELPEVVSVLASGAVNIVNTWNIHPEPNHWDITGNINIRTRAVTLNLWKGVLDTGELLVGLIDDEGRISGTIEDPKPGYHSNWLSPGARCTRQVSGQRIPDPGNRSALVPLVLEAIQR